MQYIIIDIETTGLDANKNEIIEIGAVKLKHGLIIDKYNSFVKPQKVATLPEEIIDLTGITYEMLEHAPDIKEAINELVEFIGTKKTTLIAHNAFFEQSFLDSFLGQNYIWLDTLTLAKIIWPSLQYYNLADLLIYAQLENLKPHRALSDAEATAELFIKLESDLKLLPWPILHNLLLITNQIETGYAFGTLKYINSISQKALANSAWDPTNPSIALPNWQVDKDEDKNNQKIDPEPNYFYELDIKITEDLFKKDGIYSKQFSNFEYRPEQLKMAKAVNKCLNKNQRLMVEAGTGTGKSLAYLLPLLLYAKNSNTKAAVSTHTINLQQQLLNKDIPIAKQILGEEFKVAAVKGRSNYICLRRWQNLAEQKNNSNQQIILLLRIAIWLNQTQVGDNSELHLFGQDYYLWQNIAAQSESCTAPRCPYCKGFCFVFKARRKADEADLIILNHSLLMSNSILVEKTGTGILPYAANLIIDEAHQLEKVAEDQLTMEINWLNLKNIINRLKSSDSKFSSGILNKLLVDLPQLQLDEDDTDTLKNLIEKALTTLSDIKPIGEDFFDISNDYLAPYMPKNEMMPLRLRITEKIWNKDLWLAILEKAAQFIAQLNALADFLEKLLFRIGILEENFDELNFSYKGELRFSLATITDAIIALENLTNISENSNYVLWLEINAYSNWPIWFIAPVEVKENLAKQIYEPCDSVVLTSATLSINNNFDFFSQRLGLDLLAEDIEVKTLQIDAPYDYKKQSLIALPNDLPNFAQTSEVKCIESIAETLLLLLSATRGRSLVLFTSLAQLKAVYNIIKPQLKTQGIKVLAQKISGNREKLLNDLKNNNNVCLLGANSFWEGIDVVGEALSMVVIVRLPFWPPNHPTMVARLERYSAAGKNSFINYSLPQAIIRFKQGFGRLIRSKKDYGVLTVLDRRIFEKNYGQRFIKALPEMPLIKDDSTAIAESIKDWLNSDH